MSAETGHNLPDDPAIAIQENLNERHHALLARAQALLDGVTRVPDVITSEEESGRIGDFQKQLTGHEKKMDAQRVAEKEPFLAGERAVDGYFNPFRVKLKAAAADLNQRDTLFRRKLVAEEQRKRDEAERAAREEAARLAKKASDLEAKARTERTLQKAVEAEAAAKQAAADAEDAAKRAAAKPADMARTRGDHGSVSSLKTFWDFADLDKDTVDLEYLRQHLPVEAIEQAIRSAIKAGCRDLRGVRIFQNTKTVRH